ncbi:STAS domain-containing protein [Mycolicibacterium moriokaense]|uniref:Anti-sigma factor antagonist n=1 Tax=Mycolicibacterium moriokaense TaxID=39691 RepID=A0AAD1H5S0_9MYCO|nr:STAS domain-containing protein [Mycolicibacterium moriokaense]MCV7042439.1 anti-anti-sigma factor [Mycolicibacterium moriokaense]BBW99109.1 anti-sigma factor antagonist [Mycolicibacterium moriokaense]
MYGNPAFDCGGAQVRTVCRQLATVVTVQGTVDATNIERITALAVRSIIAEKAFILDLSGVDSFSAHELSLLSAVDERCFCSDVDWSLIASEPVLREVSDLNFPIADSVPDALHQFAESIDERRHLFSPLLTVKSA